MTFKPEDPTITAQLLKLKEKVDQLKAVRSGDQALQQVSDVLSACYDAVNDIHADVTLMKKDVASAGVDAPPQQTSLACRS